MQSESFELRLGPARILPPSVGEESTSRHLSSCQTLNSKPSTQAWGNLATSLHELGRTKEALDAARKGVELDPNYAHGYNILGTLLRPGRGGATQSNECVKAYETALAIAPTFVDATLNLAGTRTPAEVMSLRSRDRLWT